MKPSKNIALQIVIMIALIMLIFMPGICLVLRMLPGVRLDQTSLLLAAVQILVLLAVHAGISRFFVNIPTNHVVCVENGGGDSGGQFLHYMCHASDRESTQIHLYALESMYPHLLSNFSIDDVLARENSLIWGLFVRLFNLHFMSFYPYARLRTIKVIRTRINPSHKSGDSLADWVVPSAGSTGSEETTEYLRILFPRAIFVENVEIDNGLNRLNYVCSVTEIRVINFHQCFYVEPNISLSADTNLAGALAKFIGELSYTDFAQTDFTSRQNNQFNEFMRGDNPAHSSGFPASGMCITGACSIIGYEISGGQDDIAKANRGIVVTRLETKIEEEKARQKVIRAEADAEATRLTGIADAEARALLEDAKASSARGLVAALGPDGAAAVLRADRLTDGSVSTLVMGGDGTSPPPVIIAPSPSAPAPVAPSATPPHPRGSVPPATPAPSTTPPTGSPPAPVPVTPSTTPPAGPPPTL